MAISPSGSIHYYWRMPDGVTIRNDAGTKLGPGIDIRGVGGMVIAPPSRRADGVYRWLNELPVANAPHWLLAAVVERQPPVVRRKSTEGGTDRGFIELLLTTIDPDASYTRWFAIGYCFPRWAMRSGRRFGISGPRTDENTNRARSRASGAGPLSTATIHYFADHEAVDAALFARLKQGYANAARTREELFGDQS